MPFFTVYNTATGECRSGFVLRPDDAGIQHMEVNESGQLVPSPGLAVLVGVRTDYIRDKIVLVDGKPLPVRRSDVEIEARLPKFERVDRLSVIVEALRAKGVDLDAGTMQAASARVQQASKAAAKGQSGA